MSQNLKQSRQDNVTIWKSKMSTEYFLRLIFFSPDFQDRHRRFQRKLFECVHRFWRNSWKFLIFDRFDKYLFRFSLFLFYKWQWQIFSKKDREWWKYVSFLRHFFIDLDLIFVSMLFVGIFQIFPRAFVFGSVSSCAHAPLFTIVSIFGLTNVSRWFQSAHRWNRQTKNWQLWVRKFQFIDESQRFSLVIFDWICFIAYCTYIALFLYFPVHYILAENYPIVTRMIILIEQVRNWAFFKIIFYSFVSFVF